MDRLYLIKNLGVATYGHYRINTDSKPFVSHTSRGKEVINYDLKYDPSTEITGIVLEKKWETLDNYLAYKELGRDNCHDKIFSPTGRYLLNDLFEPTDIYRYNDIGYKTIYYRLDAYFIHLITPLSSKFKIGNDGKIRLSEIKKYYDLLVGNDPKNLLVQNHKNGVKQELDTDQVKDPVLSLLISTKAKVDASILPEEKKNEYRNKLYELGRYYHKKKEYYRACSSNYQADRLNLVSECIKEIANIEFELIGKEATDDEDMKKFIKVFK